jgi:hypothetical protein
MGFDLSVQKKKKKTKNLNTKKKKKKNKYTLSSDKTHTLIILDWKRTTYSKIFLA